MSSLQKGLGGLPSSTSSATPDVSIPNDSAYHALNCSITLTVGASGTIVAMAEAVLLGDAANWQYFTFGASIDGGSTHSVMGYSSPCVNYNNAVGWVLFTGLTPGASKTVALYGKDVGGTAGMTVKATTSPTKLLAWSL